MLSSRDHLDAQGYERRRLMAALLGDPRVIESSAWRPVIFGALVAVVLLAASAAVYRLEGEIPDTVVLVLDETLGREVELGTSAIAD